MEFRAKDTVVEEGIMSAKDPLGNVIDFDAPASSLITHVCCVCNTLTGFTDGKGTYGDSHGYCKPCGEQMQKDLMAQMAAMG